MCATAVRIDEKVTLVEIGVPDVSSAEKIGEGGFGVVYKARQESFNRTVAVKVLTNVDLNAAAEQRFARELRAIGSLSGHPNIVLVYSHGTTEAGSPYLVMEFCEKGSYGDTLRRGRRFSWEEALDVVTAIAGALDVSHRAGIVHRDVKPDNILIDGYGVAKLADFGIARAADVTSMTAQGTFVGSAAYIAPEIVLGGEPSPASDIYALAATMHALISGESPFARDTDTTIYPMLHRITNDPPPRLAGHDVPAAVADVVVRAMSKNPADRPPSSSAFAEELRSAARQAGSVPATNDATASDQASTAREAADATRAAPITRPGAGGEPWTSGPTPNPTWPAPTSPGASAAPWGGGPPADPTWPANIANSGPPRHPTTEPSFRAAQPPPENDGSGARRSRKPVLIGAGIAVAVLIAAGVGSVLAFGGSGGGSGPTTTSTAPALTDRQAAGRLLLGAADVGSIAGSWVAAPDTDLVNPGAGYCNEVLATLPRVADEDGYNFQSAPDVSPPQLILYGAVFETVRDAESFQRERNSSGECGTWSDGVNNLSLTEPAFTPQLVGCRCQNVAIHETLVEAPDGSAAFTQFDVLAQQDRYIAGAFYYVASDDAPQEGEFVSGLIDAVVARVSEVAEEAQG